MNRGDYVADQLEMALRSAYYPVGGDRVGTYGFWMTDNGEGPETSDTICWVKLGTALVGESREFAESPHRVKFGIEKNDEDQSVVSVRAWRLFGYDDDFDPDNIDPVFLSTKITGFNCRVAYQKVGSEVDWLEEWELTNKIPAVIEVTLYLEPPGEGEDPVEIKRIVGLPIVQVVWGNK
jgi:hypothetical protein